MRARGAKVTDIVVLVVAADDGVMPQTLEAIDHAKAAKVPIIVAINKIDKAGRAARAHQAAARRPRPAGRRLGRRYRHGAGLGAHPAEPATLLLEMILLVADMQDLKANPNRPAMGTVIEAQLDRGRGPVATVLVRNGTLSVGDFFICGSVFGKVRAMQNDRGAQIRKAEPSMPVEVLGLESLPEAGDDFQVVTDTAKAKQIVNFRDQRRAKRRWPSPAASPSNSSTSRCRRARSRSCRSSSRPTWAVRPKCSPRRCRSSPTRRSRCACMHSGVGAINESDVLLASASNAIIIGLQRAAGAEGRRRWPSRRRSTSACTRSFTT